MTQQVQIELIKTVLACIVLVFGWSVGQRIIADWDVRKKRRELDIAIAMEFQKLYGEFKEVSRLWRAYTFEGERNTKVEFPDSAAFELLKRASSAEGRVEAITVKLATERVLVPGEIQTLGLFRQAYQKLREAIRAGQSFRWTHGTPEYDFYNELAVRTACLLGAKNTKRAPDSMKAMETLRRISDVRSEHWESELRSRAKSPVVQDRR